MLQGAHRDVSRRRRDARAPEEDARRHNVHRRVRRRPQEPGRARAPLSNISGQQISKSDLIRSISIFCDRLTFIE